MSTGGLREIPPRTLRCGDPTALQLDRLPIPSHYRTGRLLTVVSDLEWTDYVTASKMTAADTCLWRRMARRAHFTAASPLWRMVQPDGGDLGVGPLR